MHAWLEHSVAALRRWRRRLPGHRDARRVLRAGTQHLRRLLPALRQAIAWARVAWLSTRASVRRWRALLLRRRAPLWIDGVYRRRHGLRRRRALGYRLYVPSASAQKPLPLLVMLHGCNQDAATFAAGTRMNQLAERRGFAVLYPEQSHRANPLRCWNWFRARDAQGEGEPDLIAELIADVCAQHAIEPRRVYVAGMSAGAAMARVLTARHGALFAACGLHSGVMYGAAASAAQVGSTMQHGSAASPEATARALAAALPADDRGVPTIAIHGTADTVVNPKNHAQLAAQLLALAETAGVPQGSETQHTETVERAGGRACTVREYVRGGRVYLRSCLIEGLGHAWSGGDAAYPFNDAAGPCASELIWNFVSRHSRVERSAEADAAARWA